STSVRLRIAAYRTAIRVPRVSLLPFRFNTRLGPRRRGRRVASRGAARRSATAGHSRGYRNGAQFTQFLKGTRPPRPPAGVREYCIPASPDPHPHPQVVVFDPEMDVNSLYLESLKRPATVRPSEGTTSDSDSSDISDHSEFYGPAPESVKSFGTKT
ncbi:hypothetical protein EVAR_52498_1, partial [Eumeta japonica]